VRSVTKVARSGNGDLVCRNRTCTAAWPEHAPPYLGVWERPSLCCLPEYQATTSAASNPTIPSASPRSVAPQYSAPRAPAHRTRPPAALVIQPCRYELPLSRAVVSGLDGRPKAFGVLPGLAPRRKRAQRKPSRISLALNAGHRNIHRTERCAGRDFGDWPSFHARSD
jgi:hypothetical protein